MNYRFAVVAFVVLLSTSLPAGAVAAGTGPGFETATMATGSSPSADVPARTTVDERPVAAVSAAGSDDILHRTTVLRHRPEHAGTFETEMTFHVPDPIVDLEIDLGSEASVESVDGFEATGDGTYRWTEETDEPLIRFRLPANRVGSDRGHQGERTVASAGRGETPTPTQERRQTHGDGYTFVDTGDWGIVQVPGISLSLRRTDPVGIDETVTVDGPGSTGGDIAVFGDVTEYERTVDGETFRLVVPEAADLRESPDDILDVLADASERLAVGERDEEVFVVAAPTDGIEWGPRGLQYGDADAWVVDDAPLEAAGNVWLHEYVHVRQGYRQPTVGVATETNWLVEAQAEYYAGLLALEAGLIDFDEFSRFLERGERAPYATGVLTDPESWDDDRTDYVKGRLVAGEIDRRLRLATDGDRTLEDVFRQLNAEDERLTESDVLGSIETAGGSDVRRVAERYTRTEAAPEMWTQADHGEAFAQSIADFEYGFGADPIEVDGKPWDRWAGAGPNDPDVTAVPAGETVTIPVSIDNTGGRAGTADAALQVDGEVVDYSQPRLAAGEGTTATLSWTPPEPGEYELRVGSERLTAFVRSSASVTVTDLTVDPERVAAGESVTATATVESADDRPGAAVLAFRTAAGTVANRSVALESGETETVAATLRFGDDGRYEVAVGERTASVTVGGESLTDTEIDVDDVPGFDAAAAFFAVVALIGVLAAVGRRNDT
ncbi:CARDB domain-containing protein [Halopiger djelfimassiliensis]|uniref:CARDB domain-containing protein n=1 Tax=Halopiger djelfimassiliensis TaxID=1293047 RepID=UPI0006776DAD|nr:CARDB domain-containing protein [Halopiger djelfimassiliensis]